MKYYVVKGYNNGEHLLTAKFNTKTEAETFKTNCRFADCDIWECENGKAIREV